MTFANKRREAERRGRRAETLAAWLLRLKGYRVLARRYRTPAGEIDLIVRRGRAVAFVEVKERPDEVAALEAVTPAARRRIANAAALWISRHRPRPLSTSVSTWCLLVPAVSPGTSLPFSTPTETCGSRSPPETGPMPLKTAFQMDHVSRISIRGDSTFALMLEAERRGHAIYHYTPDRLVMLDGKVSAAVEKVSVRDTEGDHFTLGSMEPADLSAFDVVHLRQDPPFDMGYITSTHLLERIHPKTLVVNDPAHVRNAPEKLFVTEFPDLTPPTLIARDRKAIVDFRRAHGDIIVKPLYGNGGAGVFRIAGGDENLAALLEIFEDAFREPFVVQRYLPEVRAGDKRIILVDGEVAGAINRVPAAGEARSNMHVGGKAEPVTLSPRDKEICDRLGPILKERGLIFVGIDVIGEWLTEINVTSPTGIREVKRFGGPDIAALVWNAVEKRLR